MTLAYPHPAFLRDDDRNRLINHLDLCHCALVLLHQGAALITKVLRIGLNLFNDVLTKRRLIVEELIQLCFLPFEFFEFLFDLNAF